MQKLYYSISEISTLVDEEQHILRYWEKEFDTLKPKKNRSGNRVYSEKDLNIIKAIKKLIRADKLNLKAAKENLNDELAKLEANSSDNSNIIGTAIKKEKKEKIKEIYSKKEHTHKKTEEIKEIDKPDNEKGCNNDDIKSFLQSLLVSLRKL